MKIDKIEVIPMTPDPIFDPVETIDNETYNITQDIDLWSSFIKNIQEGSVALKLGHDYAPSLDIASKFTYLMLGPVAKLGTKTLESKSQHFKSHDDLMNYKPHKDEALYNCMCSKGTYILRTASVDA